MTYNNGVTNKGLMLLEVGKRFMLTASDPWDQRSQRATSRICSAISLSGWRRYEGVAATHITE